MFISIALLDLFTRETLRQTNRSIGRMDGQTPSSSSSSSFDFLTLLSLLVPSFRWATTLARRRRRRRVAFATLGISVVCSTGR